MTLPPLYDIIKNIYHPMVRKARGYKKRPLNRGLKIYLLQN
jgi:hypothetical protein